MKLIPLAIPFLAAGTLVTTGISFSGDAAEQQDAKITKMAQQAAQLASLSAFKTEIPGLLNDHVLLGTGYNSDQSEFLNVQTVAGRIDESLGSPLVKFNFVDNGSYDEVLETINGNVEVDVSFPVVRVAAGGHIAKEMAATEFSSSYIFQAYLTPKKRVLQPHDSNVGFTLTSAGDTLANDYQSKLMELAGDSYISAVEYGAQLLVNLKVEYLSERHKSDIGGKLGVGFSKGNVGVSVDGELSYIDEDLKKSIRITVRALQKGGDPKQLLNIIPNNIITCSLDNYEPCFNLFVQATNYAKNDFGNQFNSLSDYNVVRYTALPYGTSSLAVRKLSSVDQEIRFETTYRTLWLEDQFKKEISNEHRARSVLAKYSSWMSVEQRNKAELVKQAAYDNAWVYNEFALDCRNNPYGTQCTDRWNDYLGSCGTGDNLPCTTTYALSDLNIEAGSLTPFFKCETAREATASFGVEATATSLGLRNLSLSPVFVDADDPAAGAMAWIPCKQALPSYGSAFEG